VRLKAIPKSPPPSNRMPMPKATQNAMGKSKSVWVRAVFWELAVRRKFTW